MKKVLEVILKLISTELRDPKGWESLGITGHKLYVKLKSRTNLKLV